MIQPPIATAELLDAVPPSDLDAEKGVLGSLLLRPPLADEVALIVSADDFYSTEDRTFYGHLLAMCDQRKQGDVSLIDHTLLRQRLKAAGDYDREETSAYLAELMHAAPVPSYAVRHARVVRDKAVLRRLRESGIEIIRTAHDPSTTPVEAVNKADTLIKDAAGDDIGQTTISAKDAILRTLDYIDSVEGRGRGLPAGLADCDRHHGGLFPGELNILAARPRVGKSTLGLQMAMHNATRGRNVPVGDLTTSDIRRLAHQQKRKAGLELLVVDYLGLLGADNPRDPREQQVAKQARALKSLARELNVPVLCLCQLNREVEKAKGSHRPQLGNVRGSGAIEQDADVVLFIHREELYSGDDDDRGKAQLIVAKNRNGMTRDYDLHWHGSTTSFSTPASIQQESGFWEPEKSYDEVCSTGSEVEAMP